MRKLVLILFIFYCSSHACDITFYDQYLILQDEFDLAVKDTSCEQSKITQLIDIFKSYGENINFDHLKMTHPDQFSTVSINPQNIKLTSLRQLLEGQLKNLQLISHSLKKNRNSIALNLEDRIQLDGKQCQKHGLCLVSLTTGTPGKSPMTIWFEARFGSEIVAYKAKKSIHIFDNVNLKTYFEKSKILTDKPSDYLTSLDNINYYQLNKSISKDSFIMNNDLRPKTLVKQGDVVNVIYKNNGIHIELKAQALRSGKFGEQISLKNLNSGKTIHGEVTNFNNVRVAL